MPTFEFSDDEREALTRHLREHITTNRFPFAPALRPLKDVLAKLDPQPEREPLPEPKRYPIPASVHRKKRR